MKVAVIGAGGVGAYFGGRLAQAGEDVTFIARGRHLEAIRLHGLKVDSIKGNFRVKPKATDNPQEVGIVDLVLIAVKAWQVPEAAKIAKSMVGPSTLILPLQNGVESPDQLSAVLGREMVLGGMCKIISAIHAPGHVRHTGVEPLVVFGEMSSGPCPRGAPVLAAFQKAQVDARISEDMPKMLWEKFLFITAWSGLGAVTRLGIGAVRENPESRELLKGAMQEIAAIGASKGVNISEASVTAAMDFIDGLPAQGTASMQRDIAEGRPSELDEQTGAVVRIGTQQKITTPINSFLYGVLVPLERIARAKPV